MWEKIMDEKQSLAQVQNSEKCLNKQKYQPPILVVLDISETQGGEFLVPESNGGMLAS